MIGCDGWTIEATDPPMRWDRHPTHKQHPINTSFPLLFLSNTADPVCPLFAGVKMARKFIGAGLVEQKSEGHCSISAVSLCTLKIVKDYFNKGKVPAPPKLGKDGELEGGEWIRCGRNSVPFKGMLNEEVNELSVEDMRSLEAWNDMGMKAASFDWYGMKTGGAGLQSARVLAPGMEGAPHQLRLNLYG
jgi:hypothetical protein